MTDAWLVLLRSLFDPGHDFGIHIGAAPCKVPGVDPVEFVRLGKCDYNDVDRFYLDHDIIGG